MVCNRSGEPESGRSSCTLAWVRILIVHPALVVFACILLLPLFGFFGETRLAADRIGKLWGLMILLGTAIPYLIWLFCTGEWDQFVEVLKEFLRGLRSIILP